MQNLSQNDSCYLEFRITVLIHGLIRLLKTSELYHQASSDHIDWLITPIFMVVLL
jgi:hypothetical protein